MEGKGGIGLRVLFNANMYACVCGAGFRASPALISMMEMKFMLLVLDSNFHR